MIERLEPRRLLAGITIITHGLYDNTQGWVSVMADGIAERAGGLGAVSIYTLSVGMDSQNKLAILGFVPDANSPLFGQASSGETIVKLDWSTVSYGPSGRYCGCPERRRLSLAGTTAAGAARGLGMRLGLGAFAGGGFGFGAASFLARRGLVHSLT